jgi:hypothetical protein
MKTGSCGDVFLAVCVNLDRRAVTRLLAWEDAAGDE